MTVSVNKTVLDNGIRKKKKKIPHVRSVSMGVWVNVGARDEAPSENGLSHFIEHMIFKGTEKRTSYQIAKEFDAIGGHFNAFTSMERTCYHARVMDTHLETMVEILSDIFLNSVFESQEIERERPVILQELSMVEDSPEEYIHTLLRHNFWKGNPLGRSILGSRENITNFDNRKIKEFFHRYYQPDRIVISVAGNVDHDKIVELIESAFQSVSPGDSLPDRITPNKFKRKISLTNKDLEQVHICIGTRGIGIKDPDRFAFSLMNTVLGGNMQEIRERRGLAYSVYSFTSSHVDTGMFGACVSVAPEKTPLSIELLLKEMFKLKKNKIDDSELIDAKEYSKGNILLSSESTDNHMVRLAQNEIHFNRYVPLEEVIENIEKVTEEDIFNLAGKLLQPDNMTLTVLGPLTDKKAVEEAFEVY